MIGVVGWLFFPRVQPTTPGCSFGGYVGRVVAVRCVLFLFIFIFCLHHGVLFLLKTCGSNRGRLVGSTPAGTLKPCWWRVQGRDLRGARNTLCPMAHVFRSADAGDRCWCRPPRGRRGISSGPPVSFPLPRVRRRLRFAAVVSGLPLASHFLPTWSWRWWRCRFCYCCCCCCCC